MIYIYIYIYILKRIKEKIFIILYFEGGEWVTRASLNFERKCLFG